MRTRRSTVSVCLVPGHVLQAQRQAARNRVRHDNVATRDFGQYLQYGADLDVLEVERDALAEVFLVFAEQAALDRLVDDFRDLDRESAIRLVGTSVISIAKVPSDW